MTSPNNLEQIDIPVFDEPHSNSDSEIMNNNNLNNIKQEPKIEKIVVLGIGGEGNNAVEYLYQNKDYMETVGETVTHYILNTDMHALNSKTCENRIMLGEKKLQGKGAGANINVGRDATKEALPKIEEICRGVDLVFIAAGMGGGTGTYGASVIAKAAQDKGAVVVSLVTMPFRYENRIYNAIAGIKELKTQSDSLIIIENQKIVDNFPDHCFDNGLDEANKILSNAISGIIRIIRNPSKINADFEDLRTVLHCGGKSQIIHKQLTADDLKNLKDDAEKTIDHIYDVITDSPLVTRSNIKEASAFLILFEASSHFTQKHFDMLLSKFSHPNGVPEYDLFDNYMDDFNDIDIDELQLRENNQPQVIFTYNKIESPDDEPALTVTFVATGIEKKKDINKNNSENKPVEIATSQTAEITHKSVVDNKTVSTVKEEEKNETAVSNTIPRPELAKKLTILYKLIEESDINKFSDTEIESIKNLPLDSLCQYVEVPLVTCEVIRKNLLTKFAEKNNIKSAVANTTYTPKGYNSNIATSEQTTQITTTIPAVNPINSTTINKTFTPVTKEKTPVTPVTPVAPVAPITEVFSTKTEVNNDTNKKPNISLDELSIDD